MVQLHPGDRTFWCLPGGRVERGETPAEAALRELEEECCVGGVIIRKTSHLVYSGEAETCTFLVDIGDQTPSLGHDPEAAEGKQAPALADLQWFRLSEIPERDRAFLWAAGLLGIAEFGAEVSEWADDVSYPRSRE
jgi:8-oxo-dGTP pyrophosphatase MutT (NUDIX family)